MAGIDSNTVLMLHCNGTDASTTFTDNGAGANCPHTVTATGDAQIDTAQSKFGGASGLFDGTGDYLSIPDSTDWAFGTGNWTIDFWVRYTGTYQAGGFYEQFKDGNEFFAIYISSHTLAVYLFNAGAEPDFYCYTADTMITSADTWYHVAVVRYGTAQNNLYIFLDGDSKSLSWYRNLTADYSMPDFAFPVTIGYSQGQSGYWKGWIDEFRVSKGVARWTSNFTPPTAEYNANTDYTQTFTESITLSDSITKADTRTFSDVIQLTDTVSNRALTRNYNDAITMLDSLSRSASLLRSFEDTITIIEVANRDITIIIQDTIGISDTYIRDITRLFSEDITITDSILRDYAKVFIDSLTILDTYVRALEISFLDTLDLVETYQAYRYISPSTNNWTLQGTGTGGWTIVSGGSNTWTLAS